MTSYMTVTLAAARNDELQRYGARPLPLSALDAIRSSRRPRAILAPSAVRFRRVRERNE
jgi:hypothetical protein